MKHAALSLSLIVIPVLGIMASKTFAAESHIEVHTSGNGNVHVQSNVSEHSSSNVTNSNSATGHTSITIESNGETKTYESDTPGDVHMESSDGGAKVDIKNGGSSTSSNVQNDNDNDSDKKAEDIKASVEKKIAAQKDALKKKAEAAKAKRAEVKMNIFEAFFSHFFAFFTLHKR